MFWFYLIDSFPSTHSTPYHPSASIPFHIHLFLPPPSTFYSEIISTFHKANTIFVAPKGTKRYCHSELVSFIAQHTIASSTIHLEQWAIAGCKPHYPLQFVLFLMLYALVIIFFTFTWMEEGRLTDALGSPFHFLKFSLFFFFGFHSIKGISVRFLYLFLEWHLEELWGCLDWLCEGWK